MGDAAILREIGDRLKQARLDRNMTQAALSNLIGVSRRTIQKAEEGEVSTLKTLIALLRGLVLLDRLDLLLPETLSPDQPLDAKLRQRASGAGRKHRKVVAGSDAFAKQAHRRRPFDQARLAKELGPKHCGAAILH